MVVTKLRLELPNIAEVAVYPATQYVQTTTYIVLYGSASLHLWPKCRSFGLNAVGLQQFVVLVDMVVGMGVMMAGGDGVVVVVGVREGVCRHR